MQTAALAPGSDGQECFRGDRRWRQGQLETPEVVPLPHLSIEPSPPATRLVSFRSNLREVARSSTPDPRSDGCDINLLTALAPASNSGQRRDAAGQGDARQSTGSIRASGKPNGREGQVGSDVRTRGPKDPQNIAKGVSWRRASKPREVASTTLFDM